AVPAFGTNRSNQTRHALKPLRQKNPRRAPWKTLDPPAARKAQALVKPRRAFLECVEINSDASLFARKALDLSHERGPQPLRASRGRDPKVPHVKPAPMDDPIHAANQRALGIARFDGKRLLTARAVAK